MKKTIFKRCIPVFLVMVSFLFLQSCGNTTKTYVGSEACKTCHIIHYDDFMDSGHPYQFNLIDQDSPAAPTYPSFVDNDMALPTGADDWSDIAGVIGGFGWQALFVDTTGTIVGTLNSIVNTGGGDNQLNFFPAYVDFNGGSSLTDYYPPCRSETEYNQGCFKCHTTGAVSAKDEPVKNWLIDLLGIDNDEDLGFFEFGGVQCEACHGPASAHVDAGGGFPGDRQIDKATGVAINDLCGTCHSRLADNEVQVSGSYIQNHEQYDEFIHTKHYLSMGMTCNTCHNPHKRVIWDGDGVGTTCESCHPSQTVAGAHASVDCITCHMPYAAKSAQETGYLKGDVRSHTFSINSDVDYVMIGEHPTLVETTIMNVDTDGKTNLALEYVCYQCHQTVEGDGGTGTVKTLSELSDYAKNTLHQ
jgi:hypothetical protein